MRQLLVKGARQYLEPAGLELMHSASTAWPPRCRPSHLESRPDHCVQVVAQRYYKNHTTAEFRACNCNLEEGPCKEGCPCASRGLFCEKFCACGPRCTARWTGCECRSGCGTKRCPCVAAGGCWASGSLPNQCRSPSGAPALPPVGARLLVLCRSGPGQQAVPLHCRRWVQGC